MAWEYKREEGQFQQLPEGRYRIRIKSADKAISKKGNDMLALQFEVSGSNQILYHYITFMDDRPELTNRLLTQFFDAFKDIEDGDFNMTNWIGKVGACQVSHDDDGRAKLRYFIRPKQAEELPPWKEPARAGGAPAPKKPVKIDADGFMQVDDDDDDFLPPFD